MSLRKRWFAFTYDRMSAKAEKAGLGALREELLADASGDVLEIGGGTGANLAYYGTAVAWPGSAVASRCRQTPARNF